MPVRSTAVVVSLVLGAVMPTGCSSGGGSPAPSTSMTASNGSPWTPDQGFVANVELPELLSALVATPAWVRSTSVPATPAGGCLTPYAPEVVCGPPAITVVLDVVNGAQETKVSVTESVEKERVAGQSRCAPDTRVGDIHPTAGYHCADRLEWTQAGDAWVTTQRVGNHVQDCREEAVLRRGRVSVVVSEPLASAFCDGTGAELDAVPLTDAQLQTLAAAAPIVTALSVWYPRGP